MRLFLSGFWVLCVCAVGVAEVARPAVSTAPPADPADIRFVILADRTGGMLPGVFEDALAKANLLHPEFFISVGDLIDGYTRDPALLDAQWREFDAMVATLDRPFYYVPGNHDISNPWMEAEWRRRLGSPYYHFMYKDALFLVLHTEDGGKSGLSPAQGAYFTDVLARHPDVRWTFLFMHRPLWSYGNQEGFEVIDRALAGQKHTLFSGHHHHYYYSENGGNERLILGTSGGGSHLRGADVGEFHHISHVVLTEKGPKIAHLALDGFVPKDIVNSQNRVLVETLRQGSFITLAPHVAAAQVVDKVAGQVNLTNPGDRPLRVEVHFPEVVGALFEPANFERELAPGETRSDAFTVRSKSPAPLDLARLGEVRVDAVGHYAQGERPLSLPTRMTWMLDWVRPLERTNRPPFTDGNLSEWGAADWQAVAPPGDFEEGWDWSGPADASVRFALVEDDTHLHVALEVDDDVYLFAEGGWRDGFTLYLAPPGVPASTIELCPTENGQIEVGSALAGVVAKLRTEGRLIRAEVSLPKASFGLTDKMRGLRFNVRYLDHDRPENQKPSRLYWKPRWTDAPDAAFGQFHRPVGAE